MSADRGAYIDQSQSLNIHLAEPTFGKMSSMHFYAWKKGLKTGLYYLRTRPAADPIKFTVDKSKLKYTKDTKVNQNSMVTNKENVSSTAKDILKSNAALTNGNSEMKKTEVKVIKKDMELTKPALTPSTEENENTENIEGKDLTSNDDLIAQLKMACSLKNKDACTMCSS